MPIFIGDNQQSSHQIRLNILQMAWPSVVRMFLQSVVGMVDIMMVGRLGVASIAAVSVANRLMFILIGALQALAVGSTALISQYIGAKEKEKADRVVWQALLGSLLLALILCTIGFILAPQGIRGMLSLMDTIDPMVVSQATVYLRIVFISMIFGLPQITINAVLQGLGDMKTPLYLMVVSNIVNVVGNYVLIFGIGPFPAMGITGAAVATGGARVVGAILGVLVLIRGTRDYRLELTKIRWHLEVNILQKILHIGIPASVEQLVRQSSMILYSFLVASLGTVALAANEIVMNAQSFSFMPGFGFGVAATTLVGQSIGASQPELAKRYGMETTKLAALLMTGAGILLFFWPQAFVGLYTSDPEVAQTAVSSLRIVAVMQPLFAMVMVLSGALRGAGDTKWVMYATTVGNWGVRLVIAFIVAFYFKVGLIGFWIAVALDMTVRCLIILWRYQSGKWQHGVLHSPRKLGRTADLGKSPSS